jgi:hypothetical protein
VATLILIAADTKAELGRRPMHPSERYALYEMYRAHELLSHLGKRYVLQTVAWQIKEEELITYVRFHSLEPCDCDD